MSETIGIIGLGRMGMPAAKNISEKVTMWRAMSHDRR